MTTKAERENFWTKLAESHIEHNKRVAEALRATLRNITTTFPDPASVVWPDAPS